MVGSGDTPHTPVMSLHIQSCHALVITSLYTGVIGGFDRPGTIKNIKGNSERNEVSIMIIELQYFNCHLHCCH